MTHEDVLDQILPGLADAFEGNGTPYRTFEPSSREEFEPLRECLALLVAEGSLVKFDPRMNVYQITPAGYVKYKPRIDALRLL